MLPESVTTKKCPGCTKYPPCDDCARARFEAVLNENQCACIGGATSTYYRKAAGAQGVWCTRCHGFVRKYKDTTDLPFHKRVFYWDKKRRPKR